MAQTTANADAILKEYYLEPVREQLNQKAILLFAADDNEDPPIGSDDQSANFKGIARDAEGIEFAGREWVIPAHTSRNEGVGARGETDTIPTAGQQGWTDLKDSIKHNYGVIKLTRFAIRLSKRNEGAFLRLLEAETKGMANDIRKDVNRQGYGAGTGALAAVTADGANTVTVDSVQFLRVNMVIDMVNVTNDAVLVTARTITAINDSTKVVTYSGADATATTDHRLVRTGSWKKEINGLGNLINNTGTVHGVDSTAAANRWWKSVIQDAGGNQFSEDTGQQVVDGIGQSGQAEVELIITTRGIRRRYIGQLKSQKRFNDTQSTTLRGGFKAILFNEQPLVFDDDCPKGNMFFLDMDSLLWVYLPNGDAPGYWDWVDDDGAILSRSTDRTDQFEGYMAADHDLAVSRRNGLGLIKNLQDDAATQWS